MCVACPPSVGLGRPERVRPEARPPRNVPVQSCYLGDNAGRKNLELSRATVTIGDRAEVYSLALWQVRQAIVVGNPRMLDESQADG